MDIKDLEQLAHQIGFDHIGRVHMEALIPLDEVRKMCTADKCKRFAKSWSCPPACGSLELARERMARYDTGILVQTTSYMEDDFDFESIKEAEMEHKKKFQTLVRQVRMMQKDCMPLASGSCTICHKCTYPKRPCRYPDRMFPSMEAYGLWVSDVCKKSNMEYNYGKRTTTYTACILLKKNASVSNQKYKMDENNR